MMPCREALKQNLYSQTDASTDAVQTYNLTVPTSIGTLTIPTIGGSLVLNGKDSKIHVVDYAYGAGSSSLLYSTGEILTWWASSLPMHSPLRCLVGLRSTAEISFWSTAMLENCMKRHSNLPPKHPRPPSFRGQAPSRPRALRGIPSRCSTQRTGRPSFKSATPSFTF
jgi:hypothetical protein